MKIILILGAGRSSTVLIQDLIRHASTMDYKVWIADRDEEAAKSKCYDQNVCRPVACDIQSADSLDRLIRESRVVISLLPPQFHRLVAESCIRCQKSMLTASYVNGEIKDLHGDFERTGRLFLGEMGLDPGLDHMSSMKLFEEVYQLGGVIKSYESSTGGLVSPHSDDNPWHYKFSWNPRNVVTAGMGTAQYKRNGMITYVPYTRIFSDLKTYKIPGYGYFDSYPNRNSLPYAQLYGLEGLETIYRGTLRARGFCQSWDILVKIGYTEDKFIIKESEPISFRELTRRLLGQSDEQLDQAVLQLCEGDDAIFDNIKWLGLLGTQKINANNLSPADILEKLLLEKWVMKPEDKDMIIMLHEVKYYVGNKAFKRSSLLIQEGADGVNTAMSKLVGLPLSIAARMTLSGKLDLTGVHIPVHPSIYNPVMMELLQEYKVKFEETTEVL